jgi:hypothetical protein
MHQVNNINGFQTQTTYNNVTRKAFMVGQVKSTAITPRVASEKVPFQPFKIFLNQPVTLVK